MADRNPDEDIGGRSLLGVLGAGLFVVGTFLVVMSSLESDGPRYDWVAGCIVGLGLMGLVGAAVGRALGRWLLTGFGTVLIGAAANGALESLSWTSGADLTWMAFLGSMALFGVIALVVGCRSLLAHRRERLSTASTGPTGGDTGSLADPGRP